MLPRIKCLIVRDGAGAGPGKPWQRHALESCPVPFDGLRAKPPVKDTTACRRCCPICPTAPPQRVQSHLKLVAQTPPKTSTEPSSRESWIFQSALVRAWSNPRDGLQAGFIDSALWFPVSSQSPVFAVLSHSRKWLLSPFQTHTTIQIKVKSWRSCNLPLGLPRRKPQQVYK